MPSILSRPDQWLGRGRWYVTRVFLKPSVLVDLHVAVQAVLMAGPVRCASRRMSVSRHTSPLEPASAHDASACHRRAAGESVHADHGLIDHVPPPTSPHVGVR